MLHNLFIILWKNLLIRKNHYIATSAEVIIPVGLIILANLALPKFSHEIDNDPMSFDAFEINECNYRHGYYDNIVYEPSTPFIDSLMQKASCYAGYKKSCMFLIFLFLKQRVSY